MLVGFCGQFSRQQAPHGFMPSRFCLKGLTRRLSCQSGELRLDVSYVVASGQELLSNPVLLCGHVANTDQLVSLLSQRGLLTDGGEEDWLRLLYQAYGADCFKLLEGLFTGAFLLGSRLVLFASKTPGPSLYYSARSQSGSVVFTTELKTLPAAWRDMRPFAEILSDSDEDRASTTCLRHILRVRAGHCVEIEWADAEPGIEDHAYYSVLRGITLTEEGDAAAQLRAVITEAVCCLPGESADCLISGGLDSSIVASLAQRRFDRLALFSIGTTFNNEFDKAAIFAESIGLSVNRLLIDEEDFLAALPEVVAMTEHCRSTFIEYLLPVHLAHLRIGNSADIIVSGYGSDVLFAGFARPTDTLREVVRLVRGEYESTIWSNEASQIMGGVIGAEVGYPFYDSRVVDLAFSIDPFLKHKNGIEKYILRRAFSGHLTEAVVSRPKLGIHQGTGCEVYLSTVIGRGQGVRQRKDRLCYEILRRILIDGKEPCEIDIKNMEYL
jgi:(carboxyethyl)arginine beta-lactam-synthase